MSNKFRTRTSLSSSRMNTGVSSRRPRKSIGAQISKTRKGNTAR